MADTTTNKIIAMLEDGRAERRYAAALVLAELREKSAADALCRALAEPDAMLQRYALEALSAIKAKKVASHVAPLLDSDDPDVRVAAMALLASQGARAASQLERELAEAPVTRKRAIVGIMARQHGADTIERLLGMLDDPELAESVQNSLRAELESMDDKAKGALRKAVEARLKAAGTKKGALEPPVLARLVRMLGYFRDAKLVPTVLKFVDAAQPTDVRLAAHAALRRPLLDARSQSSAAKVLLEQADDEEPTIARAAIETLRALSLTPDVIPTLLQLSTNGRHAEARRYAVEKLGRSGDNKAVNTLVELLDSDDPAARETAARALSHMDSAAAALIKALPEAMSDEKRLTRLVHLIKPHARALTAAQKTTIAELAVGAVEKGSAISTPLLALLRATDPAGFAEKLTDKAMRLKRAKKFKEAFSLFRRLDEASMLGEDEARYAALVSGLCATDAKKDLGRATRTTDPILRQAVELVTVGYPVARKLKKDRTLTPEDLFFVGFNFAESQDEDEREFGGELLSHLAETSPRSKLGKSAKNKLRLVGIA
ncbi:MAG: HEAT repeat domain-containing protein [Myxococcales bacterium]|nr:HEAT repeat domain-containing protein [Myxococcales bacterium]